MEWDFGKISVVPRNGLVSLKSLRGSGLDQDDIKTPAGDKRMIVDMSAKAITERLRLVSQLTAMCLALGKVRRVKIESAVPPRRK
jgi:hypothetical protein